MKKRKFIVILILTIAVIIFWLSMKNMKFEITEKKVKSVTFNCEMIDKDGYPILCKSYDGNDEFKNTFKIFSKANVDVDYQILLLNNFEQVEFTINNEKKAVNNYIIHIPQVQNGIYETTFSITTEMLSGLNDFLIIFTEVSNQDTNNKPNFIFTKRFSVNNGYIYSEQTTTADFGEYKSISNKLCDSIVINPQVNNDSNELIPNRTVNISDRSGDYLEVPIALNIKNSIIGSPFYEQYEMDEKLHVNGKYFPAKNGN